MSQFSLNQITKQTAPYLKHEYVKPVAVAICGTFADMNITYNGEKTPSTIASSLVFGISAGIAVFGASYITPSFAGKLPFSDGSFYNGKTLEGRIYEVAIGTFAAGGVNSILGRTNGTLMNRLMIFAVSDIIGEYAADLVVGNDLSYFK